jgi:two-component system cell cycle sensor histidine kinase/response regulator CckA
LETDSIVSVRREPFPRWTMAAMAATLLALGGGGVWFSRVETSIMRQHAENQLTAVARLKVDQITSWRRDRLDAAALITESPFLAEGVARFLDHPEDVNAGKLLKRFRSVIMHDRFSNVILTDPKGHERLDLYGNEETPGSYAAALADALRGRKPVLTDLHADPKDSVPHVNIVAPIFAGADQAAPPLGAIILVDDATRFFYPLILSWPVPSATAETLLVRRDDDSALLLNNARFRPDTALKLRIPVSRTDAPAVAAVLGHEGWFEGKDYNGVESAAVILPVPDSPWFVVAEEHDAEVFAGLHFRMTLILALLAALTGGLVAIGLVAWQREKKKRYIALYQSEAALRASVERNSITLKAVGDGIIATDVQGRVEMLNPIAEALTGWSEAAALGKPLEEVFTIISEKTREKVNTPVGKVLRTGLILGLANHALLIAKNGFERPIADSAAPIHDQKGNITGVVLVFRDQSNERRAHRLMQARLTLLEDASAHGLEELLTKAVDEIAAMVDSPIGFFHFVDADQKALLLRQWPTQTLKDFCQVEGKGIQYGIDQAEVWAECARERKPVVHNDHGSMPSGQGMPEGHAAVVRELTVPVMREGGVVAIIGVGNKPTDYTESDVETVSYLADIAWRLVEEKRVEEALHESEVRFRELFDNMTSGAAVYKAKDDGADFVLGDINEAGLRMIGRQTRENVAGHVVTELLPGIRKMGLLDVFQRVWRTGVAEHSLSAQYTDARLSKWFDNFVYKIPSGEIVALYDDLTEHKREEVEREKLQAQLSQAQKMDSVGRLAGGVAHDFNNMLGVILGNVEMAMKKVDAAQPLSQDLQEIRKAAERSADLTRQLLAFARKQTIAPKVLDLNETVEGMLKMLRRLIGEDIDLAWLPRTGMGPIKMDPSQIDQILANLCLNSRDAISGVGKITIETDTVRIDEAYCADHHCFVPGDFILLAVSDDGCGMDKQTMDRLFEPFFTTKGVGRGTGLGLATVYGIVKQNNGFINVYSEPGNGTTFKIYLPRHAGEAEVIPAGAAQRISSGQGETVLIVEDEDAILDLGRSMLEMLGYIVLSANSSSEAMRLAKEHAGEIRLLITDVIMPQMNGRDLAHVLRSFSPGIKTLFMSGYTANVIAHRGVLDSGVCFIQKPFSMKDFAAKVREALDQK